jgi:hypothetical protein
MVVETGGDEKSPIILGRPFLNTTGAIIYANSAKICFNIKEGKFLFQKLSTTIPRTSTTHLRVKEEE